jgi:succinate dehydrogenase/fumarate reductase flavoprotein subunit
MGKRKEPSVSRRDFFKKGAAVGAGAGAAALATQDLQAAPTRFDHTVDVVVIGAGVSGLAAAIHAVDNGASVIAVDSNFDIGGHGMLSGGQVILGGGTSNQKKYHVEDSADRVYLDNTRPDHPLGRYNDRDIVRAFADNNVATFEFLIANGVKFVERAPSFFGASTVERMQTAILAPGGFKVSINERPGSGLVRPLEASARKKGVQFLLRHKMTAILRESPSAGKVIGITATTEGRTVNIRAKKGVIISTGGHTGNVDFRRIFDPRLTEEYQQAGEPYTLQNAEGEQAALALGASIWGTANQTNEGGVAIAKTAHIGCRNGYRNLKWLPESPVFERAGASGLTVTDWQNVILVNQLGRRFWNETEDNYEFLAAALGSVVLDGGKSRVGGPIWAIFDSGAVAREKWDPKPPNVDPDGHFFSGDTLAELAGKIQNKYQVRPMPAAALQETVARYNTFVDFGRDDDFKKPAPAHKILTPPFYAAWSTPILHDSLAGIRVNAKYQVVDHHAHVIPGLYCVGESASGFAMHGLAKCLVSGYIAGREAAKDAGREA